MTLEAFRALQESGLGVVDVGSRGEGHPIVSEIGPLVDLVGFEPDGEECQRLNAVAARTGVRSAVHLPFALGATEERRTLHLCRSRGTSSFHRPNRAFLDRFLHAERFDVVATRSVPVRSLDSLRSDLGTRLPPYLGFLKIDTQGFELDVVRGARRTLQEEIVGVEVEVGFAPLYESQSAFRDVDGLLAECGFSLFKLRRLHWVRRGYQADPERSAGQLVFGDALYLRDPLAQTPRSPAIKDARQAEALVLIASLYDLHDFALELVDAPQIAAVLDAGQVARYVRRRSRLGGLRGVWRRRGDALGILAWLHGYSRDWGRGDRDFYSRR